METATDDNRKALAAAIAARDTAGARLVKAKEAGDMAADLLAAALAKRDAARAAVVDAEETAPMRVLEMAASGTLTMDRHLKATKAAEADACDDVEGLRAAVAASRAAIADAERALMYAQTKVDAACKPVLTADIARIIAGVETLKARFDKARAALSFLSASLPPGAALHLRTANALEATPARNLAPPVEWQKAREALTRDANAPLPSALT